MYGALVGAEFPIINARSDEALLQEWHICHGEAPTHQGNGVQVPQIRQTGFQAKSLLHTRENTEGRTPSRDLLDWI